MIFFRKKILGTEAKGKSTANSLRENKLALLLTPTRSRVELGWAGCKQATLPAGLSPILT
jgi:hypothetical protein